MPRTFGASWPILGVIGLQLAVTVPLALTLNVWIDEAYSLHTTSGSLAEAVRLGIHFERQAPGYFLVLGMWRWIGTSPEIARLLSVACAALATLVAARIAMRLFPRCHPAWTAAALAWNPIVIWAAVEIRPYALAMLLGALALWACFRTSDGPDDVSRTLPLIAIGALGLYTQYYLGFLLAGLGLSLLLLRRRYAIVRYALCMAGVGAICVPIAFWLPEQATDPSGIAPTLDAQEAARLWFKVLTDGLFPSHRFLVQILSPVPERVIAWSAGIGLVAAATIVLCRTRQLREFRGATNILSIWITLISAALGFAAVGFLVNENMVGAERYWSFLAVPGTLALISIPAVMGRPAVTAGIVAILFVINGGQLVERYEALAKDGDAERVASFLMAKERPGEPILVFPNELVLPLRFYYEGINDLAPIPRGPSLEAFDPRQSAVVSPAALEARISSLPGGAEKVWLVTNRDREFLGISFGRDLFETFMEEDYQVLDTRRFHGVTTVQRLERRRAARFEPTSDP